MLHTEKQQQQNRRRLATPAVQVQSKPLNLHVCHQSNERSLLVLGAAECNNHNKKKIGVLRKKKLISLHENNKEKRKGRERGGSAGYLADNSLSQTCLVISFFPPLGYSITCSRSDGKGDSDTYLKCSLATKKKKK